MRGQLRRALLAEKDFLKEIGVLKKEIAALREKSEVLTDRAEDIFILGLVSEEICNLESADNRDAVFLIEEELKRSEERYRSIIETDPECVLILAPDGKLLEMNPAGLAMIEVDSFEQVAGRPVYPLIAPEHRDAFRELVERVCSGDTGVLEFEMIGLKGTLRWLEIHAVPLRDGGERITGLLAVARDITDRKRTEKELSQEKAFTDAVINSLPGIFYVYEEGQRLIKWNKTLETRTGYSPDELLNKHALDWFSVASILREMSQR